VWRHADTSPMSTRIRPLASSSIRARSIAEVARSIGVHEMMLVKDRRNPQWACPHSSSARLSALRSRAGNLRFEPATRLVKAPVCPVDDDIATAVPTVSRTRRPSRSRSSARATTTHPAAHREDAPAKMPPRGSPRTSPRPVTPADPIPPGNSLRGSSPHWRSACESAKDVEILLHQLPLLHRKTPRPPLSRRTRALAGIDNSSPVTGPPTTSRDDHPPAQA
jgi:hypothetical protein